MMILLQFTLTEIAVYGHSHWQRLQLFVQILSIGSTHYDNTLVTRVRDKMADDHVIENRVTSLQTYVERIRHVANMYPSQTRNLFSFDEVSAAGVLMEGLELTERACCNALTAVKTTQVFYTEKDNSSFL